MGKRARLTDDSLNTHGGRVMTAGIELAQYERNPVLLYMHERGKVIGYIKDLEYDKEKGEITGEPVFDEATELSRQCKKQWEVGSLRMLSIGIDILEMSEDPALLLVGQTCPTITHSRIFETSVVDIGANNNAIVMRREGKQITLGRDSENPLPLLNNKPQIQTKEMDIKTIAVRLGLPETADEAAVLAKIDEFKGVAAENVTLKKDKADLELAQITTAVETAIGERRLTADKKDHFITLGKTVGLETLKTTLAAMTPVTRPSQMISHSGGTPAPGAPATYKKLSEVPEDELRRMRDEDRDQYRRLYKAEYGCDCTI